MNKTLVKDIFFYIGTITVFAAGMLYVLLGDWMLTTQSLWLMLAAILAIGSAVCAVLSERFRESRHTVMYALKGIALGLAVCLMVYFVVYLLTALTPADASVVYKNKFEESFAVKSVAGSKRSTVYTLIVFIIVMALDLFAMVAQSLDIAFTATIKEE